MSYKHATKFNLGDWVYHVASGDRGLITGIELRPASMPRYLVVFVRAEENCLEMELTSEKPMEGVAP